ncbi:hypothetical protein EW145_g7335 [Phellinidium pouzarii]|uniref:Triosephosphate isomerase n=1 Tax=Phellinidium pouzarii TaxID=167371 RepID=A0A4S4KMP8_9AGAM|nr:hypothetical protein EW145_g7335 [Phellinidium pouzarii]
MSRAPFDVSRALYVSRAESVAGLGPASPALSPAIPVTIAFRLDTGPPRPPSGDPGMESGVPGSIAVASSVRIVLVHGVDVVLDDEKEPDESESPAGCGRIQPHSSTQARASIVQTLLVAVHIHDHVNAEKQKLVRALAIAELDTNTEVVIAPPSLYLLSTIELLKGSSVKVAAQNCYYKSSGAFTGEISPAQLADAQVPYVILGHSERRAIFLETSELVAQKTKAAVDAGLSVILCVGETLQEREAGTTVAVVEAQLAAVVEALKAEEWSKIVIAYEPVWAIGTGKVATSAQAQEVHAAIRQYLSKSVSSTVAENTRIVYGGSVAEKNCGELRTQPDIDGFLVGGASLKPEFVQIVNVNLKQ